MRRTVSWLVGLTAFVYFQWYPRPPGQGAAPDWLGHIALYAAFGALLWWTLPGTRLGKSAAAASAGYLVSIVMEAGQVRFGRRYEVGDLAADLAGLMLAAVVMALATGPMGRGPGDGRGVAHGHEPGP